MFCPCLSVCLSVSKITQKRVHGYGCNVACRQMSGHVCNSAPETTRVPPPKVCGVQSIIFSLYPMFRSDIGILVLLAQILNVFP